MKEIYQELGQLLADFDKDGQHVKNNNELLLKYADDFYDILVRTYDKLSDFWYN